MVGPGVPSRHGGLTKVEACPAWGRRFHPPQGLLLAGPSPTAGGSAVGRPGCQQGPAGGDCPISPSPWAQGWPWALSGVPLQLLPEWETPPRFSRAPSATVASLCWTPHSSKPTPETSEKRRQLPPAPHCLWMLSLPVGWALREPGGTRWPWLHSSPPCPHRGPGCTGLPTPERPPPGKCPCKVCPPEPHHRALNPPHGGAEGGTGMAEGPWCHAALTSPRPPGAFVLGNTPHAGAERLSACVSWEQHVRLCQLFFGPSPT